MPDPIEIDRPAGQDANPTGPPAGGRPRILVVDDETELVASLRDALADSGFHVVGFDDPIRGLAAVIPGAFDVLLVDLMMPGMDGVQVARAALQIDPHLSVVVMTGQASVPVAVEAMQAGATDFLQKPFRLTKLMPVLDRALATRRVREEQDRQTAESRKALEEANARLAELAATDPLTGLANRRAFDAALGREVARAGRLARPLSLAMLDVDHFKAFNDAFGHPAGDDVLRQVARTVLACCRGSDFAARVGGEEFAVLLPATDSAGARTLADRIRASVEEAPWSRRPVTVSAGVATLANSTAPDAGPRLVADADRALYAAKARGRNGVACSPPESGSREDG